jgi:hypothetical protein
MIVVGGTADVMGSAGSGVGTAGVDGLEGSEGTDSSYTPAGTLGKTSGV